MEAAPGLYRRFLLFALPIVAMIGIATGATALLALAAAGGAVLALAFFRSRRALLGLGVTRRVHSSAFEDDAVRVDVRLENRSPRPAFLVDVEDEFGASVADHKVLLEPGPLPPARRRPLVYHASCSRGWGEYRVGPLAVCVSDPAGLFQSRRRFYQLETLTVFPRVHPVPVLRRSGARASLHPQERTQGRFGQSLAYLGVREYRPGDDVRSIHWPVSARLGQLAVKEHEIDLVPYFTLFLDLHRDGRAGTGRKSTHEYVIRTAASLLWQAALEGDFVQVLAEGHQPMFVSPGRGQVHATRGLYELVRGRQEGRLELLDLVEQNRATLPIGSTVALLSASLKLDPLRLDQTLTALAARDVRTIVFLVDDSSFLQIQQSRTSVGSAQERREALRAVLHERGVPSTILAADVDLPSELGRPDLLEAS